jgi:hypothetical protein
MGTDRPGGAPLVTAGLLNKQIAAEALRLGADGQVPAHTSMKKMEAESLADRVRMANGSAPRGRAPSEPVPKDR